MIDDNDPNNSSAMLGNRQPSTPLAFDADAIRSRVAIALAERVRPTEEDSQACNAANKKEKQADSPSMSPTSTKSKSKRHRFHRRRRRGLKPTKDQEGVRHRQLSREEEDKLWKLVEAATKNLSNRGKLNISASTEEEDLKNLVRLVFSNGRKGESTICILTDDIVEKFVKALIVVVKEIPAAVHEHDDGFETASQTRLCDGLEELQAALEGVQDTVDGSKSSKPIKFDSAINTLILLLSTDTKKMVGSTATSYLPTVADLGFAAEHWLCQPPDDGSLCMFQQSKPADEPQKKDHMHDVSLRDELEEDDDTASNTATTVDGDVLALPQTQEFQMQIFDFCMGSNGDDISTIPGQVSDDENDSWGNPSCASLAQDILRAPSDGHCVTETESMEDDEDEDDLLESLDSSTDEDSENESQESLDDSMPAGDNQSVEMQAASQSQHPEAVERNLSVDVSCKEHLDMTHDVSDPDAKALIEEVLATSYHTEQSSRQTKESTIPPENHDQLTLKSVSEEGVKKRTLVIPITKQDLIVSLAVLNDSGEVGWDRFEYTVDDLASMLVISAAMSHPALAARENEGFHEDAATNVSRFAPDTLSTTSPGDMDKDTVQPASSAVCSHMPQLPELQAHAAQIGNTVARTLEEGASKCASFHETAQSLPREMCGSILSHRVSLQGQPTHLDCNSSKSPVQCEGSGVCAEFPPFVSPDMSNTILHLREMIQAKPCDLKSPFPTCNIVDESMGKCSQMHETSTSISPELYKSAIRLKEMLRVQASQVNCFERDQANTSVTDQNVDITVKAEREGSVISSLSPEMHKSIITFHDVLETCTQQESWKLSSCTLDETLAVCARYGSHVNSSFASIKSSNSEGIKDIPASANVIADNSSGAEIAHVESVLAAKLNDSTEGSWDRLEFSFDDLIEDLMTEKQSNTSAALLSRSSPLNKLRDAAYNHPPSWVTNNGDEPTSRTQFLLSKWYDRRQKRGGIRNPPFQESNALKFSSRSDGPAVTFSNPAVVKRNAIQTHFATGTRPTSQTHSTTGVSLPKPFDQRKSSPVTGSKSPSSSGPVFSFPKSSDPAMASNPDQPGSKQVNRFDLAELDNSPLLRSEQRSNVDTTKPSTSTCLHVKISDYKKSLDCDRIQHVPNKPSHNHLHDSPPLRLAETTSISKLQRQKARLQAKRHSGSAIRISFAPKGVAVAAAASDVEPREMRSSPDATEAHKSSRKPGRDELLELSYTLTSAEDDILSKSDCDAAAKGVASSGESNCDSDITVAPNKSPTFHLPTLPINFSGSSESNKGEHNNFESSVANDPQSKENIGNDEEKPKLSAPAFNFPSTIKDVTETLSQFTVSAKQANGVLDTLLAQPSRLLTNLFETYRVHQSQEGKTAKNISPRVERASGLAVGVEKTEEPNDANNGLEVNPGLSTPSGKNKEAVSEIYSPPDPWAQEPSNHFIDNSELGRDINWGSVVDFFVSQEADTLNLESPTKKEILSRTETTANETRSPDSSGQPLSESKHEDGNQWEGFGSTNFFDSDLNSAHATSGLVMFENLANEHSDPFLAEDECGNSSHHYHPIIADIENENPSPVKAKDLNSLFFKRFEASFDSKDGDLSWKTPPFLFEV